jgi:integrase
MSRPKPPHLYRERTRHGLLVWYVRRGHGARIRLRAEYNGPEFWQEYRAALAGTPKTAPAPTTHTLAWAIDRYRQSSAWAGLSVATRRQTENIFKAVIKTAGSVALRDITSETLTKGREKRKGKPHAANNFLKSMRRLFKWGADPDGGNLLAANPALGVKLLRGNNPDGWHTWTEEEITRFEERWPIGTRERLALDLLLYTGFDRGDVVRLGRQHVKNGQIEFRMAKARGVGMVYPPMLQILAETIAKSKTGDLTYLVTEDGTPFTKESFGNWFRDACVAAKVPGRAHGLRKAAATRCAENGATVPQLMAMFGWSTEKMAVLYTKKANRRKLAAAAAALMLPAQAKNVKIPHLSPGAGENQKSQAKTGA